jgi:site-specific DNA-methyltransferase (adenine-specific)
MINITNEDNMDLMSRYEDNYFDLAIVDPPYGIKNRMQGTKPFGKISKKIDWNKQIPKKEYFKELLRVSKNQIIWGANYYANYLSNERDWIVWDKKQGDLNFSMHELAWTSFSRVPKIYRHIPPRYKEKFHPTEKPVKLYEWLLTKYAKKGDKILDTHLGSGSIAIACHNLSYDLTACELDKEYFKAAMKRIKQHQAQLRII